MLSYIIRVSGEVQSRIIDYLNLGQHDDSYTCSRIEPDSVYTNNGMNSA